MKILAIETSCDETAAAVIENGTKILSNVVVSQIDLHSAYGGVVPELAARSHIEAILPVVHKALTDANLTWNDVDALAVTDRPGLIGSLLIGTLTARTLAILHNKPLYPVHHLKSHIYANWLTHEGHSDPSIFPNPFSRASSPAKPDTYIPDVTDGFAQSAVPSADQRMTWQVEAGAREKAVRRNASPKFPLLALVISGGHTQIVRMSKHNDFEIIGATRDDAIGECFDKVAKILGLPYPGGPSIAKTAETGDSKKYPLPTPKVDGLDFSFSGLKTAVLRSVQKTLEKPISFPSHELAPLLTEQQKADFAASFQTTAINILLAKLEKSLKTHPNTKSLLLAGGVSANKELAKRIKDSFSDRVLSVPFFSPVKTTTFPDKDFEQACGACLPLPKSGQTKCCSFDIREQKISTESTLSEKLRIFIPNPQFSTDNAAMVGAAAFYESQTTPPTDPYALDTSPVAPLS